MFQNIQSDGETHAETQDQSLMTGDECAAIAMFRLSSWI